MRALILTFSIGTLCLIVLLPIKLEVRCVLSGSQSWGKIILWIGSWPRNIDFSRIQHYAQALAGTYAPGGHRLKFSFLRRIFGMFPLLVLGNKLLKQATCELLHINVGLGFAQPYFTAIGAGLAWACLGVVSSCLQSKVRVVFPDKVKYAVSPRFLKPELGLDFWCILKWRLGHIIVATIRFVWWWITDNAGRKERPLWRTTRSRH